MNARDEINPIKEQPADAAFASSFDARATATHAADSAYLSGDDRRSARSRLPQFGMRGMLIFTTCLCVLFAVLAALRVAYWEMLVGFVVTSAVSLIVILTLELYMHSDSERRRRDGVLRRMPPRLGHRASPRTHGSEIDLSQIDPTGIEFLEPPGIAFLDSDSLAGDGGDSPMMADFAGVEGEETAAPLPPSESTAKPD